MRASVASAMVLVLVSVIALCPAVACPLAASHAQSDSCCHKHQTPSAPCHAKSVPDCPYSILQKSKTSPTATHAEWVGSIASTAHSVTLPVTMLSVNTSCRLVDVSGLFLRIRVLLI